jgi:hypothetical protein
MNTNRWFCRLPYARYTVYDLRMEKRNTILEVMAEQNQKSIDRLDRSIVDLRSELNFRFTNVDRKFTDVDRKFTWLIGMQFTIFIAIIGIFAKLVNIF